MTTPTASLTRAECYGRHHRASNVDFELAGGFRGGAVARCACLADMNSDGDRDRADIWAFVDCFLGGGVNCGCADGNAVPDLDPGDLPIFVNRILSGLICP